MPNPLVEFNVQEEPPPERVAVAKPIMPGTVFDTVSWRGVVAADGVDGAPEPAILVAATVKVYAVPFVRPETTNGLVTPLTVAPPGLAVTV